jgi:adenylosuccinate synthase
VNAGAATVVHAAGALPRAARAYLEAVESFTGTPMWLVSVGPDRADTVVLRDQFAS